ncbi:MAG TPA: RQC domain-containing protein, partial [Blastocatellia bacterium]|nr:RQC domain-containing protein [Blastocatellia bacterium]
KGGLLKEIVGSGGAGIVYAATRKSVEQITAMLKMSGISATAYHGGMEEFERTRTQDAFMSGRARAIVATNAFGMGIDKPDIRFVVHYHIPGSIEAYYQEVGRAGRDGEKSDCLLLFNYADTRTQQFFIEGNHPSPEVIDDVYRELWGAGTETVHLSAREISKRLELRNDMSVTSALSVLEKAGHIERGRTSDSVIVALMRLPIDKALDAVTDESREGRVLRELIFDQDVNEREQTELDLRRLSSRLQMTEALTRRALATLSSLGLITYRNLFSGRGIRLLDEKPVRQLRIDARELASRAAAEQAKLRRMLDYCYWEKGCLQRFILNYFGDPKQMSGCGICSNCRREADFSARTATKRAGTLAVARAGRSAQVSQATPLDRFIIDQAPSGGELREELRRRAEASRVVAKDKQERDSAARELDEDEVVVVKKVLSCVARLKGRFGKGTVAAVLRGSRAKQVIENHLDELSTYGLLRDMSQDEVAAYIRALMEAGCIVSQQSVYPTVALSEFGREVMVGRREVMLELPLRVSR